MNAEKAAIGEQELREANTILRKYKSGKTALENKTIENEQWWKLRHWRYMKGGGDELKPASAWLFNVIINKHADGIEAFPEPNVLPREESDREEASRLSSIIPAVLEQNDFEETYSDVLWQKLKTGTGIYGVFWDGSKLNGLGDIAIKKVDILNIFWEPGITDLQKSRNIFTTELIDNDVLEALYPSLKGRLAQNGVTTAKYIYDDAVDTSGKSLVVDWYYRKYSGGKCVLHYCKYVNTTVIYATENDTERPVIGEDENGAAIYGASRAQRGWYDHGKYPFVFDRLFPSEGTPCGFGYIDVCKNAQEQIDRLNQAIVKNAVMAAAPRFFIRGDGSVNEKEFADWTKPIVHVNGNLGADEPRPTNSRSPVGDAEYGIFDRYDFLERDDAGELYWNDDFLFSCDTAGMAQSREALWQAAKEAYQSGAFGDPRQTDTRILYWAAMEKYHYPNAGSICEMLKSRRAANQEA